MSTASASQLASLAVLPLRNSSGDPEQAYLSDGMTEALITDLSRIAELKVISRSLAMRYKGTDKPPSEIARELNVDAEETYKAAVANWTGRGRPDAVAALEGGWAEGGFKGAMSALGDWKTEKRGSAGLVSCMGAVFNFAAAGRNRDALDCLELDFENRDPNLP